MAYKKIKPQYFTEEELREIWKTEYCNAPIVTFDGISVKFYEDKFDHLFYESESRKLKDKYILSLVVSCGFTVGFEVGFSTFLVV